jgi:hypothetical protein
MNVVENQYHFVLVCPAYRSVRTHFLQTYHCSWPNVYKLEHLLKAANKNNDQELALNNNYSLTLNGKGN